MEGRDDERVVGIGLERGSNEAILGGHLAPVRTMLGGAQQRRRVARVHRQRLLEGRERARGMALLGVHERQRDVGIVGAVAALDRPLRVAGGRPRLRGIVDAQVAVQVREQAVRPLVHRAVVQLARRLEDGQEHGGAALDAVVAQGPLERVDGGGVRALPGVHDGGDEQGVVVVAPELEHAGRVGQRGRRVSAHQSDLGQRQHGLGIGGRHARFRARLRLGPVQIARGQRDPRSRLLRWHPRGRAPKVVAIEVRGARVVASEIVAERARRRGRAPEEAQVHPRQLIQRREQHDGNGDDQQQGASPCLHDRRLRCRRMVQERRARPAPIVLAGGGTGGRPVGPCSPGAASPM